MRLSRPLRRRRGAKRIDLTDLREVIRDRRVWTGIGIVVKPSDAPHFEIVGDNADVMIEVQLQPEEVPITARLAAGMWIVPNPGEEVAVIIPAGRIDFMPVVVCVLAAAVPSVQGPALNTIVIARGPGTKVLIHDGEGGAQELAFKQDVINVDQKYAAHIHLAPDGATGGPLATTVPNPPNPSFPVPDAVHPFLTVPGGMPTTNPESPGDGLAAASIIGTSVLLAK